MTKLVSPFFVLVGVLLFLVLLGYAILLGYRLIKANKRRKQALNQIEADKAVKDLEARQAIQVIARALLQKDLSDTEAAMRISYLSQQVIATPNEHELFSIFQQLAESTAHIPILDDWIALERSEKHRLTTERERIEQGFREFVRSSAERLTKLRIK
jgi:hypothetical protein